MSDDIPGDGSVRDEALPGLPPESWSSRGEMMRAREQAVEELERAATHDWRRLVVGAVSLLLVLFGGLAVLAAIAFIVRDQHWGAVLVAFVIAGLALGGGGTLGVRTWRTGRGIVTRLVAWEGLSDRIGPDGSYIPQSLREYEDAQTSAERKRIWLQSYVLLRTRDITFPRIGRIVIAVALIMAGGGLTMSVVAGALLEEGSLPAGGPTMVGVVAVMGLTVLLYGCVIFGGLMRFSVALGRRGWRISRRRRTIRTG